MWAWSGFKCRQCTGKMQVEISRNCVGARCIKFPRYNAAVEQGRNAFTYSWTSTLLDLYWGNVFAFCFTAFLMHWRSQRTKQTANMDGNMRGKWCFIKVVPFARAPAYTPNQLHFDSIETMLSKSRKSLAGCWRWRQWPWLYHRKPNISAGQYRIHY